MTRIVHEFERVNRPHRWGDAQMQHSSLIDQPEELLRRAIADALRDYPGKRYNGFRYEIVADGAGIRHHNLTAYFTDDAPGLDPRNVSGTEQAVFGQYLNEEEMLRLGIGVKDTR